MPKFNVKVLEVHSQIVTVEAEDEDAARLAASEVVNTGISQDGSNLPEEVTYEYTLDYTEWNSWKAE